MKNIFRNILVAAILIFISACFYSSTESGYRQECFMVLVGKSASGSGSVMLAHNNDLTGKEKSFLEIIPACGDTGLTQIDYSNGLTIKLPAKTSKILIQRINTGFMEGDAVAINEYGVAIAGGVALGSDRNLKAIERAPLTAKGLPGGIRYDILARSRTARECVEMLGNAYTTYGVSYPSGVGIADSSEIWYIECGGGKQWAAVRIPDSCCWVQANGYRIGEIDTADNENFLTSPGLIEFCMVNNLWDPDQGAFNFSKAFGEGRTKENGGLKYDRLRVWRGINLLSPSLNLKSSDDNLPLFLKPDKPITEPDLFKLLRDFYQGTPFDVSLEESSEERIRCISCREGVHSSLIVITPSQPAAAGAVLWSGIGSSLITGFVPVPFGVTSLPEEYTHGDTGSAFEMFYNLSSECSGNWNKIKQIQNSFLQNEEQLLKRSQDLVNKGKNDLPEAEKLNSFTSDAAEVTLNLANNWLYIKE